MTETIDIANLRALAEAATPGPWALVRHTSSIGKGTPGATDDWTIYGDEHKSIAYEGSHPRVHDPDYIAAANPPPSSPYWTALPQPRRGMPR